MADREGNVIKLPGQSVKAEVKGDEILYSYAKFTQKGRTIAGGQGVLEAGTVMARKTSSKKYVAYATLTDEVQTLTEGGSGLTSFTITYAGQTTASIDDDATAAQVQAALEALSNIAVGDVTVTGGPLGTGPFSVTFGGTLANTDVAAMTTTPTGGTGTVVVATQTAGGADVNSDGEGVAVGILRNPVDTDDGDILGNIVISGIVKYSKCRGLDTAAITDLKARVDTNADYVSF